MSYDDITKDWMVDMTVPPAQMLPVDPPTSKTNDRLLSSILCLTLGETLSNHSIDKYLLDHIELECECSKQSDLCLAWSDDVSLALCFIVSLTHYGGYSKEHLAQQYINWWTNG